MKKKAILGLMTLLAALPVVLLQQGCVGDFAPLNVMVLTATPTATVAPPTPTKTPIPLYPGFIDDMEDNNNGILVSQGRNGYWYSYNDGTGGGAQAFTLFAPGVGYGGIGASSYCVRIVTNASYTNWGSGFGFSFTSPQANYNASAFTGIQFFARNATGNLAAKFMVTDNAVVNAIPAYSVGPKRVNVNFTTTWTAFEVTMAALAAAPNDYAGPTVFNPAQVQQCQWGIPPAIATDVQIDNMSFY
jgi:hypothetical protein